MTTVVDFGGLVLESGPGVIVPRPWTLNQSRWAAALAVQLPAGPILELCAGCGCIGLEAARRARRPIVLVDASEEACRWAVRNAAANGLADQVDVRHAPVHQALAPGERFPLILADPPYVPTAEVARYPDDPVTAIDGGPDGLGVLADIVAVAGEHLAPGGAVLVQVRGRRQAEQVAALAQGAGVSLHPGRIRVYGVHRAVVELRAELQLRASTPTLHQRSRVVTLASTSTRG